MPSASRAFTVNWFRGISCAGLVDQSVIVAGRGGVAAGTCKCCPDVFEGLLSGEPGRVNDVGVRAGGGVGLFLREVVGEDKGAGSAACLDKPHVLEFAVGPGDGVDRETEIVSELANGRQPSPNGEASVAMRSAI